MAHSIGKTIAELRKAKGWTQVELAEKLGVSDKAISKWESEGGFPEITQLPVLASVFDVSIDYLMTGKTPEAEIIVISKAELCAKNDDATMLDSINVDIKDEKGKTVIDYAKAYGSKNVLTAIINKYGVERIVSKNYRYDYSQEHFEECLYFAVWTNTLNLFVSNFQSRHYGNGVDGFRIALTGLDEKCLTNSFLQKLFKYLTTDESIPQDVFDTLFSKNDKDIIASGNGSLGYTYCKPIWDVGVSYLFECAIKNQNEKLFDRYFEFIRLSNKKSSDAIKVVSQDRNCNHKDYYGNTPLKTAIRKNPYIAIRISSIEWLIANEDIELAEKLHNLNVTYGLPSVDNDILRVAKLKASKCVDEEELAIQSSIHGGVLSVSEILATKNHNLIKNALSKYPIHFIETLISWYMKENWRAMLEYAIDNNVRCTTNTGGYIELAHYVVNFDKKSIGEYLFNSWYGYKFGQGINAGCFYYYEGGVKKNLFDHTSSKQLYTRRKTPDEIIAMVEDALKEIVKEIDLCKKRILEDFALQFDKETTIGSLTKEFFYNELEKGNTDIVIIKLCVRLEAILKSDYHYEGDFSEMLKKYCDEKLNWREDDGWGYMVDRSDEQTIRALHSLRIKRNSIVHSEKSQVDLTMEDIRYCIEYICKMG